MLAAPLEIMRADLSLPAMNDGWFVATEPGFVARHAPRYELARGLWDDAAYDAPLARLYAEGGARDSAEALLFGPDTLPPPDPATPASTVQGPSGHAVLRGGAGAQERWLLLKYGPHGGGHGHPDKLALDLHAFSRPLAPDLGTPGYGIPLNRSWYRHTLAHNTVLLDGAPQPPATGELVRFTGAGEGAFAVADARVSWPTDAPAPYAGVTARRCILWWASARPYFLDLVLVRRSGDAQCQIDLAWHHRGALDLPGLEPGELPPAGETYTFLRDIEQLHAREWHATWRLGEVGTALWGRDPRGATLFAAGAPDNPAAETLSLLLRRVTATEATFAAVCEPFAGAPSIRHVAWQGDAPDAGAGLTVSVEGDGFRDIWRITGHGQPEDPANFPDDATVHEYALDPPVPERG